ncbi:MAG TPA: DUF1648 domain-containing protein [Terriglobales bacterium]|nr:DUF1648 domain-containing protein [Terriglobales bacterium]
MNRKVFQAFTWLMWLALPITAFRYWQVWDRLPLRMATHFDINGQPNGWMPPETALLLALGTTAFTLAIFTTVSYFAHKTHIPDAFSWALLGFLYLVVGFAYALNSSVVQHNLDGQPFRIDFWIVLVPVAIVALVAVFLSTKRGDSLPVAGVIAEEAHGSRAWSLVFIALLLAQFSAAIAIPIPSVRIASTLVGLLFAVIAIHIWTGFHYLFTGAGVEIRTLGFRLRSIPRVDIRQYAVESWSPLRGYGIRGIGNRRAYVWCNQGVRIQTTEGEVFLGHNQPERIVHDLDAMKQFAH